MEASATSAGGGRSALERSPLSRLPDRVAQVGADRPRSRCPAADPVLLHPPDRQVDACVQPLRAQLCLRERLGPRPTPDGIFHGLPLLVGTLVTSAIALIIGVPIAVATALFLTELCPRRRAGRWRCSSTCWRRCRRSSTGCGASSCSPEAPAAREVGREHVLASSPRSAAARRRDRSGNYFIAGLILAIMILPIVSAISREVLATVPPENKEAALALGATRWEMIRMSVLPYARPGITGGAMLGPRPCDRRDDRGRAGDRRRATISASTSSARATRSRR